MFILDRAEYAVFKEPEVQFVNAFELCRAVCDLSPSIYGAAVINNARLVAMHAKPNVPIPNEERFTRLFFQAELIANIMAGNADFFGEPYLFSLYFKNAHLHFFHLSRYQSQGVMALQVSPPSDHQSIISEVNAVLESSLKT